MVQKDFLEIYREIMKETIPKTKSTSLVREKYEEGQKGPKSLDELLKYLSTTTKSKIFDIILEELHNTEIACSIFVAAFDEAGEVHLKTTEMGKITEIDCIELPNLRRYSMMFFPWLFEGVRLVYLKKRIGMYRTEHSDILVLPYLIMLYAIEKSKHLFDEKVIKAAKARYITSLYSSLFEGIATTNDAGKVLVEETMKGIKVPFDSTKHVVGIIKAITLYKMREEADDFEDIFDALLDNTKPFGKEFAYNQPKLHIQGDFAQKKVRRFIADNIYCLRNLDEPDEYERPNIKFE